MLEASPLTDAPDEPKAVCRYFAKGSECRNGDRCQFLHILPEACIPTLGLNVGDLRNPAPQTRRWDPPEPTWSEDAVPRSPSVGTFPSASEGMLVVRQRHLRLPKAAERGPADGQACPFHRCGSREDGGHASI